jgi:hypothetical protein
MAAPGRFEVLEQFHPAAQALDRIVPGEFDRIEAIAAGGAAAPVGFPVGGIQVFVALMAVDLVAHIFSLC